MQKLKVLLHYARFSEPGKFFFRGDFGGYCVEADYSKHLMVLRFKGEENTLVFWGTDAEATIADYCRKK